MAFWVRSNFTCCWESHDCLIGRCRDAGLDEHIRHYKINTTLSFDTGRGRQKFKVRSHCTKTHQTPYKKDFDIMLRNSSISVPLPEHASAWHFVTPTHRANARFPAPLVAHMLIAHTASSHSTAGMYCPSGPKGPVEQEEEVAICCACAPALSSCGAKKAMRLLPARLRPRV